MLSSPSGAGKTTLSRALLAADPNIRMSVSVTTRPPRPGEIDGKDYYFISKQRFAEMRDAANCSNGREVFGNFYGTPRRRRRDWRSPRAATCCSTSTGRAPSNSPRR